VTPESIQGTINQSINQSISIT